MSRTVEYTHRKVVTNSSVISELFYNTATKELYVRLVGGTVAGYASVPAVTTGEFFAAESKGAYWNSRVKPWYHGLNGGGDIVFSDANPAVEEVVAPARQSRFAVEVSLTGTMVFNIDADDLAAAVAQVQEMLDPQTDLEHTVKGVRFVD